MTVTDPCGAPASLTPSAPLDQEYTITQTTFDYQVPAFTVEPDWCAIAYSYTISDPAGNAAFTFDAATLKFSFE